MEQVIEQQLRDLTLENLSTPMQAENNKQKRKNCDNIKPSFERDNMETEDIILWNVLNAVLNSADPANVFGPVLLEILGVQQNDLRINMDDLCSQVLCEYKDHPRNNTNDNVNNKYNLLSDICMKIYACCSNSTVSYLEQGFSEYDKILWLCLRIFLVILMPNLQIRALQRVFFIVMEYEADANVDDIYCLNDVIVRSFCRKAEASKPEFLMKITDALMVVLREQLAEDVI